MTNIKNLKSSKKRHSKLIPRINGKFIKKSTHLNFVTNAPKLCSRYIQKQELLPIISNRPVKLIFEKRKLPRKFERRVVNFIGRKI